MRRTWIKYLVVFYFSLGFLTALLFGGGNCLPPHLANEGHSDRVLGFRWMSRELTARCLVQPPIPLITSRNFPLSLARNGVYGPKPIPGPNQMQVSLVQVREGWPFFLPYLAVTAQRLHFRIGVRWDDVDHYYTLDSIALKMMEFE